MDGPRFDAWTRRHFGLATSGIVASLLGLLGPDETEARHRPKHRKKGKKGKGKGKGKGKPRTKGKPKKKKNKNPPLTSAPDIILINVDDMRESDYLALPQTQVLLGEQGATYPNFFLTTPLCAPSRASLLRGQYAHNSGVLRNMGTHGGWSAFNSSGADQSTIATWLSQGPARYRTAFVGKYLNGYRSRQGNIGPGWSDWFVPVPVSFYNYTLNANGNREEHGDRRRDYLTDVMVEKARAIIASTPSSTPLFLYFTPKAPHGPSTPAPRHEGDFANHQLDQSGSFNEADMDDKPEYMQHPLLTPDEIASLEESDRKRLESLKSVDDAVVDIVDALAQAGRLQRAYLFFVTDNGFLLGQHRRSAKQVPYEDAIRMSMLVRGPGIGAGEVNDAMVANIDLAPTIAALAGVTPPAFVDGRSFVETFAGSASERQALLIEAFAGPGADDEEAELLIEQQDPVPPYRAIRTADWLYVEYHNAQEERELYDLNADPDQLQSLHDDPGQEEVIQELSAWLATLDNCQGTGCRSAENSAPSTAASAAP